MRQTTWASLSATTAHGISRPTVTDSELVTAIIAENDRWDQRSILLDGYKTDTIVCIGQASSPRPEATSRVGARSATGDLITWGGRRRANGTAPRGCSYGVLRVMPSHHVMVP